MSRTNARERLLKAEGRLLAANRRLVEALPPADIERLAEHAERHVAAIEEMLGTPARRSAVQGAL